MWVGASFGVGKLFSTAQQIVLARLLLPEDFGLLGIALLAIGTLDVFTQTGLEAALVQRRNIDNQALNTGWTLTLCRAVLLTALLYGLGPSIALFFQMPRAGLLLQVLALTVLLDGMANIGVLQFKRELNFRPQVLLGQSYLITNLVLSVGLTLLYRSVWAMVIARVVSSAVRTTASYAICPYQPRLGFNRRYARDLFHFGKFVFLGNIFLFLAMRGDDALVGKILGATTLGFYTFAYALSNTPTSSVTYVISRVAFPTYAKLQDDLPALRSGYHKALRFTALLALPVAIGLLALAPDAVRVIYGEKWMPMVPAVQILCIFGAIRALGATTGPVFHGVGRPEILTRVGALQLVLTALLIYPPTRDYGILGTSIAVTLASFLTNLVTASRVANIIGDRVLNLISLLFPSLAASGIMAVVLLVVRSTLRSQISLTGLVLLTALGAGIYALVMLILDRNLWNELKATLRLAAADT